MKTPQEWSEHFHVRILDADGWRHGMAKDFSEPIGELEFLERLFPCTVHWGDHRAYAKIVARHEELSSESN